MFNVIGSKIFSVSRLHSLHPFRFFGRHSQFKVTIYGTGDPIDQYLGLLLKQSPYIDELGLLLKKNKHTYGNDLSRIDTNCKVVNYSHAKDALQNTQVLVTTFGCANNGRKNKQQWFTDTINMYKEVALNLSQYCSDALIAIATPNIESILPWFNETLQSAGTCNPAKIFGVISPYMLRANVLVAEILGLEPECVTVPVIAGASHETIVPVLSLAEPYNKFTREDVEFITNGMRKSMDFNSISTAVATGRSVISLIKGLKGQRRVVEYYFVKSDVYAGLNYFTGPIVLGPNGIQKILAIPDLNEYERCLIARAIEIICESIETGEELSPKTKTVLKMIEPLTPHYICPMDWCESRCRGKSYCS